MKRYLWLVIFFTALIWSAIAPHDRFTWALEVAPAVIGLIVIVVTFRYFQLTPLSYSLILIHCLILMVGGHYTYAEVPLFNWFQDVFDLGRNSYDKLGHFAQGFVPVIIAREIFIRRRVINGNWWRHFMVICFCLALSAFYELVEWWTALLCGESAEAFLGTQGYIWDTQSDMAFALLGAILSLVLLRAIHNQQLKKINPALI